MKHPAQTLLDEVERLRKENEAAERELERWRHNVTVEGDFVCPDSIRMTEAEAQVAALKERVAERGEALVGYQRACEDKNLRIATLTAALETALPIVERAAAGAGRLINTFAASSALDKAHAALGKEPG